MRRSSVGSGAVWALQPAVSEKASKTAKKRRCDKLSSSEERILQRGDLSPAGGDDFPGDREWTRKGGKGDGNREQGIGNRE